MSEPAATVVRTSVRQLGVQLPRSACHFITVSPSTLPAGHAFVIVRGRLAGTTVFVAPGEAAVADARDALAILGVAR